jgi:hypothetical protein
VSCIGDADEALRPALSEHFDFSLLAAESESGDGFDLLPPLP